MMIVFAVAAQTALQLSDYWLAHWVQMAPQQLDRAINDVIYVCLVIAAVVLGASRCA